MRYSNHTHSKTIKNVRTKIFLTHGGTCCGHVVAHVVGTLGTTKTFCVKTSWNLLGFILYSFMRYFGHSHSKTKKNARTNFFLTRGGTCCGTCCGHPRHDKKLFVSKRHETCWDSSFTHIWGILVIPIPKLWKMLGQIFFWHAVAHVVGTLWHMLWAP